MPWGGKRAGAGRKALPRLTPEEFDLMVKEQGGMCALCSEPGSAGGLVIDRDELKKRIPACCSRTFLASGRGNPLRFKMAITYLGRNPGS